MRTDQRAPTDNYQISRQLGRNAGRDRDPDAADAIGCLGDELAFSRRFLSWSQADIATKAGLSVATIKRMEAGDTGVAISSWYCLAHALNAQISIRLHAPR